MNYLKDQGELTFEISGGMISSIEGKENPLDYSSCWMLYTSDKEMSNTEWGTIEYDGKTYTGRSVTVRITHILEGFEGLAKGWCMFSFVTLGEAKENCLNKIEEIRLIGSADSNQVMNRLKECVENYQSKGLSCEINYKPTVEHDETDYTVHNIIVIGRK